MRPPTSPKKTSTAPATTYTEKDCYECLIEMEAILKQAINVGSPSRTGRRKTQALPALKSASRVRTAVDVLRFAGERGWVQ